jgi:hypothetical protein
MSPAMTDAHPAARRSELLSLGETFDVEPPGGCGGGCGGGGAAAVLLTAFTLGATRRRRQP